MERTSIEGLVARLARMEERLAAVESERSALAAELAGLRRSRQPAGGRLWLCPGAAALFLIVGLLSGSPQAGQAQGTLEQRVAVLEGKLARVSVANGGADIIISGANLNLINGAGSTQTANGLGNLILGYNEARGSGLDFRSGSHNLVLGQQSNYTSFGGIIGGFQNQISGPFAHVLTGYQNGALNFYSCVTTGEANNAANTYVAILGGGANVASGNRSCVSGGVANTASGYGSSVSGGSVSTASGTYSAVSGGYTNSAGGTNSTIGGGRNEMIGTAMADQYDWRAAEMLFADM
jgi:hypothetical protein